VPTVTELGLPQLTTTVWFGLSGPKNMPAAITKRLTEAHQKMTASPEFKNRMASAGLRTTLDVCGEKFNTKMGQESDRWARLVKSTGFVADN
jgi:tripartite-type tricarboxylate transporter receptor subunit TctC